MLQNEAGRVSRTMKLNVFPLYPLKFKTHVVLRGRLERLLCSVKTFETKTRMKVGEH